ncbi:hypothetical protein MNBD_GAMMA17-2197 [hydrothermal vent metagenome]|uniref:Zn-ribbon-containing, possibly RNA-binding protein and truncated derivatives n=1 Tax=hydrothermal vent metagenome TaxID=652676 RepID=A0A3B0ZJ66_9ZZZZ
MRHSNSVKKLLISGKSTQLRRLTQFSSQLTELSALTQSCLPPLLQGHCQAINVRGKTLILQTESPAWASQLRFYMPAMLSTLTHHQCNYIKEIHIRIKPVSAQSPANTRHKMNISSQSAILITSLAETTPYSQLRQSLLRLASRESKKS